MPYKGDKSKKLAFQHILVFSHRLVIKNSVSFHEKSFYFFVSIVLLFSCEIDDSMTPVSGSDDLDLPVSDSPIIAEFRPNLSELHIYIRDLKELQISSNAL
jgi:hypothetical protein